MSLDLTRPYRAIWLLTWPQLLMMICNFFIGMADVWVCGRINPEAQAAMGLITQAMFFFLTVGIALSNGSVAALSQSLGAGRTLRAKRYSWLCLMAGLGLGGLILGAGFGLRQPFVNMLNAPPLVSGPALGILTVFFWLLPIHYLFLVTNAVLRAHKLVLAPLASMGLVCLVNTWLDLGLGLGWWGLPDWGYLGVAWSTFWSVSAGLGLNLALMRRAGLLRAKAWPRWRWVRRAWGYMFKVAWPSGLMQVMWHCGYLVLLGIIGRLGAQAVPALAGFAAGARLESGVVLPAFAFNLSASILVGHALGAGRPREAKRMGYRVLGLGVGLMSLATLALWPNIDFLARLLAPDPAVAAQTESYLRYNFLAIPFTTTTMIMAGALTGAGATLYTMAIFGLAIWGVRLPVAWYLGLKAWHGADGIWLSMLVSQIFQGLVLLMVFQFKNWARFSMIKPRSLRV